jgi:hypothetical protein
MATDSRTWIDRFAEALGVDAPSDDEVAQVLDLAGVAAHAAERTAAPVSCWMAARAGVPLAGALVAARELAASLEAPAG